MIKNISNYINSKKRGGVGVIMAVVFSLFGLLLVALMFNSTTDFVRLFARHRRVYVDSIIASNYIERMKGAITTENVRRRENDTPVLRGEENNEPTFEGVFINSVDGLLLEDGFGLLLENIEGQQRRVEVRVFDAFYLPRNLAPFTMSDYERLPPSLFMIGELEPDWAVTGRDGRYEEFFAELEANMELAWRTLGAYVVRVEIYDTLNDRLVRVTEEAFIQFLP